MKVMFTPYEINRPLPRQNPPRPRCRARICNHNFSAVYGDKMSTSQPRAETVAPAEVNVSRNALSVARMLDRVAAECKKEVITVTITTGQSWRVEISEQKRVVELVRQK